MSEMPIYDFLVTSLYKIYSFIKKESLYFLLSVIYKFVLIVQTFDNYILGKEQEKRAKKIYFKFLRTFLCYKIDYSLKYVYEN